MLQYLVVCLLRSRQHCLQSQAIRNVFLLGCIHKCYYVLQKGHNLLHPVKVDLFLLLDCFDYIFLQKSCLLHCLLDHIQNQLLCFLDIQYSQVIVYRYQCIHSVQLYYQFHEDINLRLWYILLY